MAERSLHLMEKCWTGRGVYCRAASHVTLWQDWSNIPKGRCEIRRQFTRVTSGDSGARPLMAESSLHLIDKCWRGRSARPGEGFRVQEACFREQGSGELVASHGCNRRARNCKRVSHCATGELALLQESCIQESWCWRGRSARPGVGVAVEGLRFRV